MVFACLLAVPGRALRGLRAQQLAAHRHCQVDEVITAQDGRPGRGLADGDRNARTEHLHGGPPS
jgi:hypothetical protein